MNYQKNETVASGLVKPKTTAIFFDKLWLPYYSNVFIGDIPEKILLMDNGTENLSGENDFCSRLYWFGAVTNITSIINKEKSVSLRSISIDSNDGLFSGVLVVGIGNAASLDGLIRKIANVKGVKNVERNR